MRVAARIALLVAVSVVAVACGGDPSEDASSPADGGLVGAVPEVHVFDAWLVPGDADVAEIGARIHNAGPEDDRLLEATCACEGTVTIDGAVVVGPNEEIVLAPGGTPGLRLTDLAEPLPATGRFVSLTFAFEHAGEVTAEAEVRKPA